MSNFKFNVYHKLSTYTFEPPTYPLYEIKSRQLTDGNVDGAEVYPLPLSVMT